MNDCRSHRDLVVWQRSIVFAGKVYAVTRDLPSEEHVLLKEALRRGAVTVASKISEGHACKRRCEFLQCLERARAALFELETHITIAIEQKLLFDTSLGEDIQEVSELLTALIRRISTARQLAHAKACTPSRGSRHTSA